VYGQLTNAINGSQVAPSPAQLPHPHLWTLTVLHCLHRNLLAGRSAALAGVCLDNHMVLGELVEVGQHRLATEMGSHLDGLEAEALRGINLLVLWCEGHLVAHIVAEQNAIPVITLRSIPGHEYLGGALGICPHGEWWTRGHFLQRGHLHHFGEFGGTQLVLRRHPDVVGLRRTQLLDVDHGLGSGDGQVLRILPNV